MGGFIEVETLKPVSQSYLTSLWDHEAFRKTNDDTLNTLTNDYSRRFTRIVLVVALAAAGGWALAGDYGRGLKAFASVLIVACPCALALAAPFALGTAQRLLARLQVFLRNAQVMERLARVNTVVFDKTGTLTGSHADAVTFHSDRGPLTAAEETLVFSLARHSTHPHSVKVASLYENRVYPEGVSSFLETAGRGIEGRVNGHEVWLGSRALLEAYHCAVPREELPRGGQVLVAIDGKYRGAFVLAHALRPEAAELVQELGREHHLALLSGDNDRERAAFEGLFGPRAELRFNQAPVDKLEYVRTRQEQRAIVMMVGDGLNDAGALKQSDVGVAVVERIGSFSPASDVILAAPRVADLRRVLDFSRGAVRVVKLSFAISALYNAIGISIAAAGVLSPLICAVLMPLSSVTVVGFACSATNRAARRAGLHDRKRF
jgi:Cu+-exporting ATPase